MSLPIVKFDEKIHKSLLIDLFLNWCHNSGMGVKTMEKERERIKGELINIINEIEDLAVLKYLFIFIRGKLKVG